ncbi:MAG: type IV secretion protein Rhs, partial [Actinobacteria bacterium]|nr:type IV secretion protein Rhs [Actinomycetota bacterium]
MHNGDGTWTFTRHAREIFQFDTAGRLTAVKDLNGYTTRITYPSGTSRVITDPSGRALTLTLVGTHVSTLTDGSSPPRQLTYSYDVSGNLTDVLDVGGGHWQFTYDSSHHLLTMRSPRFYGDTTTTPSPVVTNLYDGSGRVTRQTDQLGRATNFDYTSMPSTTKVTDPKGNVTLYNYNYGVLTAMTRGWGSGNESTWSYRYDVDTAGRTLTVDPNGHTAMATFDAAGNMLTKTDGLGRVTTYAYNSLNEVTSYTEPKQINGHAIIDTATYDAAGNLRTRSAPLMDGSGNTTATATTTYHYDDPTNPGDVTSVTDPNNNTASYAYDGFGDVISETKPPTPENASGNKTTYAYDTARGWRTSMVAPKGNVTGGNPTAYTTTYAHDAYGRVTVTKDPLWTATAPTQHQTVSHYDADGNLDSFTDGGNHTTSYVYDAAEEQSQISRADGSVLRADYFADGTLNHQYDGANQPTTYTYDELGHLLTMVDPLGRSTSYSYDALGNLRTLWDPMSRATTYSYDAGDQLISIKYSDGTTPNVSAIGYDADGQRISMSDGTGTSGWAWDSLHRLTSSINGAGQTVGYGYDLGGRLSTITYPGTTGTVTRTYDAANRLATVRDWGSRQTAFGYDADSNLVTQSYSNTTTTTNTFDAADRLM